jgi:hypothetical protein
MGRYLAIGLTHQAFASREEMTKQEISIDELRQEIQKTFRYDLGLYDEETTDKHVVFTLKDAVLKDGLLPFLNAFYPIIYSDEKYYRWSLEHLQSTAFPQWLDLAKEKELQLFQYDQYGDPEYIWFSKGFQTRVVLRCNCIILYLGRGRVDTEGVEDFSRFFKYCLHEAFKEHAIAKALRFYYAG